jgi:hypothetical protein
MVDMERDHEFGAEKRDWSPGWQWGSMIAVPSGPFWV